MQILLNAITRTKSGFVIGFVGGEFFNSKVKLLVCGYHKIPKDSGHIRTGRRIWSNSIRRRRSCMYKYRIANAEQNKKGRRSLIRLHLHLRRNHLKYYVLILFHGCMLVYMLRLRRRSALEFRKVNRLPHTSYVLLKFTLQYTITCFIYLSFMYRSVDIITLSYRR